MTSTASRSRSGRFRPPTRPSPPCSSYRPPGSRSARSRSSSSSSTRSSSRCWSTSPARPPASRKAARAAPVLLAATALGLWLEPVFQTFVFGQVNLALTCLVLWDLSRPDGARLKGFAIGIAAGIKLTPAIFAVYLLVTGRVKAACYRPRRIPRLGAGGAAGAARRQHRVLDAADVRDRPGRQGVDRRQPVPPGADRPRAARPRARPPLGGTGAAHGGGRALHRPPGPSAARAGQLGRAVYGRHGAAGLADQLVPPLGLVRAAARRARGTHPRPCHGAARCWPPSPSPSPPARCGWSRTPAISTCISPGGSSCSPRPYPLFGLAPGGDGLVDARWLAAPRRPRPHPAAPHRARTPEHAVPGGLNARQRTRIRLRAGRAAPAPCPAPGAGRAVRPAGGSLTAGDRAGGRPPARSRATSDVLVRRQQLVGVDDPVRVALLGQEALAVRREVLVDGVAGDDRVEARLVPVRLRPQHPAQPLGLLLARAEGAGDLDRDRRLRQVDGEVRDLRDDQHARSRPARKASNSFSRCALVVSPLITGASRCSPSSSSWSMYCPMTSVCSPWCLRTSASVTCCLLAVVAQKRYFSSVSAVAYASRSESVRLTRTSTQSAGAMYPCASISFHGASKRLGPISEKTSDSRPSSRTSVAVSPSRRRAWRSAVNLKTGAGSRCTSS